MREEIRVLHITEMLQAGGIESFIMNVYRNIDRTKVQFDFLVTRDEREFYDKEIEELGGKKIIVNKNKNQNVLIRVILESIEIYKILKKSDYNIIHVHSGTPLRVLYILAAKLSGVKTRIYHSHSAEVLGPHNKIKLKKMVFAMMKNLFGVLGTKCFACSKLAAEWMYPKYIIKNNKVEIIHNGIDINKFKFNYEIRKKYRESLNLDDNIVVGHIGRFNEQKNHEFLIDIFKEIYFRNKEARLLLIGKGELENKIKEKVKSLGLEKCVIFAGVRDDINNMMQAMDVFVLPSHYEGLPVVGVEAQASGLNIIMSDNISNEVVFTDNVTMMSLQKSAKEWAEVILNSSRYVRKDTAKEIIQSGYDIKSVSNYLQNYYLNNN